MTIEYQNKWCKIISRDGFYVLQSKADKYNDQYFLTLDSALIYIGAKSK